jgi:two-component system, sensor histidine kinase
MIALDRIRAEQVKSIYQHAPAGTLATLLAVTIMTAVLVFIGATRIEPAAWFSVAMCAQAGGRLLLYRTYLRVPRAEDEWRLWARRFCVAAVIGGLVVGFGAVYIMTAGRADLQVIALLLVFAFSSGAVGAFGVYLPAIYLYLHAVSIGPVGWLLWQGDTLHIALGGLYLLWLVAMMEQAHRLSVQFVESVRLRFEKLDLAEDLRREKAVAEQANAEKSRFLAAASHDLRQPVHALSLFVEALRPRTMDAEARVLLDHIDNSVHAMGGLFGGLLDISRLDAGVVEVNRTDFAIQPLLERVCRDLQAQARDKGLELELHRCSAFVHSDPVLLERVLRNIIANAVTYTDKGRVVVGCRRGSPLSVQVWDTGRGIPTGEQQRVFQEFYQLGNPERDRSKGVGLGLAIVKRLTTLLDCPLRLQSVPGKGSVFSVAVPLASTRPTVDPTTAAIENIVPRTGGGLVLVVDDELAIQVAMKSLLQSWGYEAVAAGSGDEMLERIVKHPAVPRLIICDYRLRDGGTGLAVIERLRSEYNQDIPGMLITGDTAPDRLKEAQASGYLLLHKPVPNARLRAAITHLTQPQTEL